MTGMGASPPSLLMPFWHRMIFATNHDKEPTLMTYSGKNFEEAGKQILARECKPPMRVYADLEYLQDLRYGAMCCSATLQDERSYIVYYTKRYNIRYDFHTASHFPALGKTDEELDAMLRDSGSERIFLNAPFTTAYKGLVAILAASAVQARRFFEHPEVIRLTINCTYKNYPEKLLERLRRTIQEMVPVQVEFTSADRYVLPYKEYQSHDLLLLHDYGTFVRTHAIPYIHEGHFLDNRIVAQPYIEDKILKICEDPEEMLRKQECNLDLYSDFRFLRATIETSP